MDSLITAAARALAAGDPLGALKRVALRDDAAALALRGIAMAQLGSFPDARRLLRRARRKFDPRETVARARCVVAEAEIALASRELGWAVSSLAAARRTLARHGDSVNAAHARQLEVRRLLLLGRLQEAASALGDLDPAPLPPASRAMESLVRAGLALRQLRTQAAIAVLAQAEQAASAAGIPGLMAEVAGVRRLLATPAARQTTRGVQGLLLPAEIEALLSSEALVVDARRRLMRQGEVVISLARRPVLFALLRALAEVWPDDVPRDALIAEAFGARLVNDSHRVRLRVELGRLRKLVRQLGEVRPTKAGFALAPRRAKEVVVLASPLSTPDDAPHDALIGLLADGEAWSSSALALALGASQRTIQRALDALSTSGKVQSFGKARARRWLLPPVPGFATSLLLLAPLPVE